MAFKVSGASVSDINNFRKNLCCQRHARTASLSTICICSVHVYQSFALYFVSLLLLMQKEEQSSINPWRPVLVQRIRMVFPRADSTKRHSPFQRSWGWLQIREQSYWSRGRKTHSSCPRHFWDGSNTVSETSGVALLVSVTTPAISLCMVHKMQRRSSFSHWASPQGIRDARPRGSVASNTWLTSRFDYNPPPCLRTQLYRGDTLSHKYLQLKAKAIIIDSLECVT